MLRFYHEQYHKTHSIYVVRLFAYIHRSSEARLSYIIDIVNITTLRSRTHLYKKNTLLYYSEKIMKISSPPSKRTQTTFTHKEDQRKRRRRLRDKQTYTTLWMNENPRKREYVYKIEPIKCHAASTCQPLKKPRLYLHHLS